jgi:hypothetical protein
MSLEPVTARLSFSNVYEDKLPEMGAYGYLKFNTNSTPFLFDIKVTNSLFWFNWMSCLTTELNKTAPQKKEATGTKSDMAATYLPPNSIPWPATTDVAYLDITLGVPYKEYQAYGKSLVQNKWLTGFEEEGNFATHFMDINDKHTLFAVEPAFRDGKLWRIGFTYMDWKDNAPIDEAVAFITNNISTAWGTAKKQVISKDFTIYSWAKGLKYISLILKDNHLNLYYGDNNIKPYGESVKFSPTRYGAMTRDEALSKALDSHEDYRETVPDFELGVSELVYNLTIDNLETSGKISYVGDYTAYIFAFDDTFKVAQSLIDPTFKDDKLISLSFSFMEKLNTESTPKLMSRILKYLKKTDGTPYIHTSAGDTIYQWMDGNRVISLFESAGSISLTYRHLD